MSDTVNMPAGAAGGNPYPRRFHQRVWPWLPFVLVVVPTLMVLAPAGIWALEANAGRTVPWQLLVAAFGGGTVTATGLSVLFLLLALRLVPVRVGPAGLRGHTGWGRPVAVPWAAPATVEPTGVVGVPYLRLRAAGCRPVLLPARMVDPHGLAEAVADSAGADHPLAAALRDRLPAD